MPASFYWYDLETSGTDPRWDRVIQFAGVRTDMDLQPVGDEQSFYIQLPDDVLPNPDATLVTGITPEHTRQQGISEWHALAQVEKLFAEPDTCVVGYNSLRFDDEFVRYGFYRTLRDPYAREWQNGNSRWDIIDLVRATGALRPAGITWPVGEDGLPVYRLELLTQANDLEHGHAHDALSDVHATIAMARLIKQNQPKLFDYFLNLRRKKSIRKLLEPTGANVCIHVSGMYPRSQFGTAPVVSVCRHPRNSNSIVVADLSQDVEPLLNWSAERIREALFARGAAVRPPLKEIRVNRCPFVAELAVLTPENWSRLGFDAKQIKERQRRLAAPGIAQKVAKVYDGQTQEPALDVEAALYEGFLQDADRRRCATFAEQLGEGDWVDLDYSDQRLGTLAQRLKARSFASLLSPEEGQEWHEFVSRKLHHASAPWLTLAGFQARLQALLSDPSGSGSGSAGDDSDAVRRRVLLLALQAHGEKLARQYPVPGGQVSGDQ
jgi:exodeoxyribonuclease-1